MASTLLFVILVIIAALLLLTASITATLAANNAFSSARYNSDNTVRSAHQNLVFSAALGWSALAILIVILIVAVVAGGFSNIDISDAFLNNTSPTKEDLVNAYRGQKELSAGHTTQIVVLVVLILLCIVTIIVGILAAVAASQLSGVRNRDDKIDTAYSEAIAAAVSGIAGIALMIFATLSYAWIRAARANKLKQLEAFETKTEQALGVTDVAELEAEATPLAKGSLKFR